MFAKFNLMLPFSWDFGESSLPHTLENSEKIVRHVLEDYALEDGSLDASAIELDWFPEVDSKAFLSHSHADERQVKQFAAYLYDKYGITSFIDSTVWGYADDLINLLNSKYCDGITDESELIKIRNYTSSFAYILLQSALAKMIDHCECFIFVNTPNSIKLPLDLEYPSTRSIWLYNELLMGSRIRCKPLYDYRKDEIRHADVNWTIPVEMNGLVDLTIEDFENAKACSLFKNDPNNILETIYYNKGILKRQ